MNRFLLIISLFSILSCTTPNKSTRASRTSSKVKAMHLPFKIPQDRKGVLYSYVSIPYSIDVEAQQERAWTKGMRDLAWKIYMRIKSETIRDLVKSGRVRTKVIEDTIKVFTKISIVGVKPYLSWFDDKENYHLILVLHLTPNVRKQLYSVLKNILINQGASSEVADMIAKGVYNL